MTDDNTRGPSSLMGLTADSVVILAIWLNSLLEAHAGELEARRLSRPRSSRIPLLAEPIVGGPVGYPVDHPDRGPQCLLALGRQKSTAGAVNAPATQLTSEMSAAGLSRALPRYY